CARDGSSYGYAMDYW
nr:immunoglobulin heavy chain junction region [Mus musculus]